MDSNLLKLAVLGTGSDQEYEEWALDPFNEKGRVASDPGYRGVYLEQLRNLVRQLKKNKSRMSVSWRYPEYDFGSMSLADYIQATEGNPSLPLPDNYQLDYGKKHRKMRKRQLGELEALDSSFPADGSPGTWLSRDEFLDALKHGYLDMYRAGEGPGYNPGAIADQLAKDTGFQGVWDDGSQYMLNKDWDANFKSKQDQSDILHDNHAQELERAGYRGLFQPMWSALDAYDRQKKASHFFTYQKSASAVEETDHILQEIYEENPSHWPNGLAKEYFDGGLYLVRKEASQEPVGFVGWQERLEGFDKVGYYSVGIRPQFRRAGFAKQALSQLIAMKSAGVDRVRALVKDTNEPSKQLAASLGVPVKLAALKQYLS